MKYGLFLLIAVFLSCSKDDAKHENFSDSKEKWVETQSRTDTIYFEILDGLDLLYLNRGKEIRNGSLLPKGKSGPYQYRVTGDKISLYWMLSSNSAFNDYYFKIDDKTLSIGNFYESEVGEILTFEKLD
jgi:hypothetical protein